MNKKLGVNIILQTSYQVFGIILPFITAPYVARVLGVLNSGIYAYTYSIVNYFMLFAMLGIDFHGNRSIASVKNDKKALNRTFTEIFLAHVIGASIVLIIYLGIIINAKDEYKWLFTVQIICIIGELININWLFNGLGEFKVTVVRNVIIKTITAVCIFVFVKNSNHLLLYTIIMSVGSAMSTSAVWLVRRKYVHFCSVDFNNVLKHFKPLVILYFAIMASSIMKLIDKTMLESFGLLEQLGCYEYAEKIVKMPLSIVGGIGTVMLSVSSSLNSQGEKDTAKNTLFFTLRYITAFSSFVIFGMILFGRQFCKLYLGPGYELTPSILYILSVSFLFTTINDVIRTQYFIPLNKDKYYVVSLIIGAIVNVILNILLVKQYGAIGTAVATVIAYATVTSLQLYFSRHYIPFSRVFKDTAIPFTLGIIPFFICIPLNYYFRDSIIMFFVNAILYLIVFALVFLFYMVKTKQIEVSKIFQRR